MLLRESCVAIQFRRRNKNNVAANVKTMTRRYSLFFIVHVIDVLQNSSVLLLLIVTCARTAVSCTFFLPPAVFIPSRPQLPIKNTAERPRRGVHQLSPMKASTTILCVSNRGDNDKTDYEHIRRELEEIFHASENKNTEKIRKKRSPPFWTSSSVIGPLNRIDAEKRKKEIRLLASLQEDDAAMDDLWDHWYSELGPGPAIELLKAEEHLSRGPSHWDEAESAYRSIIDRYCYPGGIETNDDGGQRGSRSTTGGCATPSTVWAEPINRLATLLYMQGRFEESRKLCEIVLTAKPWHFGCVSGMVMVCARLGDRVSAEIWAGRRLPPLQHANPHQRETDGISGGEYYVSKNSNSSNNSLRKAWVKRAVTDAARMLMVRIRGEDDAGLTFVSDSDDAEDDDEETKHSDSGDGTHALRDEFKDAWQ